MDSSLVIYSGCAYILLHRTVAIIEPENREVRRKINNSSSGLVPSRTERLWSRSDPATFYQPLSRSFPWLTPAHTQPAARIPAWRPTLLTGVTCGPTTSLSKLTTAAFATAIFIRLKTIGVVATIRWFPATRLLAV